MKNTDVNIDVGARYIEITPWKNKINHGAAAHQDTNYAIVNRVGELLATAFLECQQENNHLQEQTHDPTNMQNQQTKSLIN